MVTSQNDENSGAIWVDRMPPDSSNTDTEVTIGMCIKNSGATIKEAIQSVLNQDFPHELIEIIIVDGHSRDQTLGIVRSISQRSDIRIEIYCENEGLGRARQIVVDKARGKYIVWVDGDMILSRDFVKKQVEFMEHFPDAGAAKGKYGILIDVTNLVAFLEDVAFMLNTVREREAVDNVLATSGCIYRVRAIREVGGFDPCLRGVGEDMDAESRLRDFRWKLYISSAMFQEIRRQSWSALWNEYFWHGQGAGRLFEKNRYAFSLYKMFPPVALAREVLRVPAAYKLTREKRVLFLPFHYIFKRVAWSVGFVKALLEKARNLDIKAGNYVFTHI